MDVEFETSKADLAAFQEAAPPLPRWQRYAIFTGLFLLYGGPAILPYFVSGRLIAGAIWFAILASLWGWLIYLGYKQDQKQLTTGRRICVRLAPRGLIEREQNSTAWIAWSLIDKVNVFPSVIQVLLKTKMHLLIPTRAFASEAERQRFIELAEQYKSSADGLPAASFPDTEDEFYPAWDAGITQSIDYKNSADELAVVHNNGVPEKKSGNIYVSSFYTLFFLVGALIVLALGIANPAPASDMDIPMYFASFTWCITALIATTIGFRWYTRLRIPAIYLAPRRLTMAAKGYLVQLDAVTLCGDWKNLEAVEQNEEIVAFKNIYQQYLCVVPKKAFATPQLAQEFADEAQLYWQDAQQPDETELGDDVIQAELADGDNPYRSPHA